MTISKDEISNLLHLIASSEPDATDCEGCFNQLSEFVEQELLDKEIPDALRAVQQHLEQCACCRDEHDALLEALRSLDQTD